MPVVEVGDVVYASFPWQEGDVVQDRPTLVIVTDLPADSAIVCMITKQPQKFDTSIELRKEDFLFGEMDVFPSYVRPYRVSTIDRRDIRKKLGQTKPEFVEKVKDVLLRQLISKSGR